jgi:hypothetical protein
VGVVSAISRILYLGTDLKGAAGLKLWLFLPLGEYGWYPLDRKLLGP